MRPTPSPHVHPITLDSDGGRLVYFRMTNDFRGEFGHFFLNVWTQNGPLVPFAAELTYRPIHAYQMSGWFDDVWRWGNERRDAWYGRSPDINTAYCDTWSEARWLLRCEAFTGLGDETDAGKAWNKKYDPLLLTLWSIGYGGVLRQLERPGGGA